MNAHEKAAHDLLMAAVKEDGQPRDMDAAYREALDEIYSFKSVGGPFACMQPSRVLEECDPTAYRCGFSDWLDEEVPVEWLGRFLGLIYDTPDLTWLLLSKRPENWNARLEAAALWAHGGPPQEGYWGSCIEEWLGGDPPANVWIGTSVEDQSNADLRIPEMLKIPAVRRFLSLEPLLGPVDLVRDVQHHSGALHKASPIACLDWLIIGGESGHGARPCNVEWIRSLVKQGKEAGVATFVKHPKGGEPSEWPVDLRVRGNVWTLKP